MIPKIIHYCWFNPDRDKPLPETVQRCVASWQRLLPDFEIRLWSEDTFNLDSVPFTRQAYTAGKYGYVPDYIRLWAVYHYGGVYLDADVEVLQRFDHLLLDSAFMGLENPASLGTAIIGAEPKNPLIKHLLQHYDNRAFVNSDGSLNDALSNWVFNDLFKSYGITLTNDLQRYPDMTIYPKAEFYPHNCDAITDQSLFIHHLMVSHVKTISVVMPVYNGEQYLRECIDSVLAQTYTNYELIIVDDGSTDQSAEIIRSYVDDRIVYIYKSHSGIVDSLNMGVRRASGRYIARMDADDIMSPNRLQVQCAHMAQHPQVDVLGTGMRFSSGGTFSAFGEVTMQQLQQGNQIAHPTVMIKSDVAKAHPYSAEYPHAEDYALWFDLIKSGYKVFNIPDVLLTYRQHGGQIGATQADEQYHSACRVKECYADNLTVIISFKNEGEEVDKTVRSIRQTTRNVSIILINDASNDGYDYRSIAATHGCRYEETRVSLGVASARDYGVSLCETPYFMIIDGHMRFYDHGWDRQLIDTLAGRPNALVCSNTVIFTKDKQGVYDNEDGKRGRDRYGTLGAIVNLSEPGYELTAKWSRNTGGAGDLATIPCVLGAAYATSVQWWRHICGLHGLLCYGGDEPLMSIKTWLAGGEVLILRNWGVGHLYRDKFPYQVAGWADCYNALLTTYLLCPERFEEYSRHWQERVPSQYARAMGVFGCNKVSIDAHRNYLHQYVLVKPFSLFEQINNKNNKQ